MTSKQIFTDIGVVLALPAVIIGIHYYLQTGGDALLMESSGQLSQARDQKVTAALATLESITFDASVFESPAFRSLRDFQVPVVESPLGRPNPFVPTDDIVQQLKKASASPGQNQETAQAGATPTVKASPSTTSGKLDAIKKSGK